MPLAALFIGGVLPTVLSRLAIEHSWLYEMHFRMILKIILNRSGRQAPSSKLDKSWIMDYKGDRKEKQL
jgi:hypothetical protein